MKEKPFKSLFQKLGWAFLFLRERRQYFFRNFFYYPNLIGMGNKVQALNYVPLFTRDPIGHISCASWGRIKVFSSV
jgi:hypothetical protein